MAEDITPALLQKIQNEFQERFEKNRTIASVYEKVKNSTATYSEANDFAIKVGEILAEVFKNNLSSEVLPDGKMYYNIAERILNSTMKNNYNLITEVTSRVQEAINKAAGIGIKAIVPDFNQDRVDGLVRKVSGANVYDDIAWALGEPVIVAAQSIVDDSIKKNAEFQYEAGLAPKIVRKSTGKCCAWCNAITGTYAYPDVPKDIYRRHDYCRCTVDYMAGKKQRNVHNNNTGARRYVQDEYGNYTLSSDARIEHANKMVATERMRKEAARRKRIETWSKKRNTVDESLEYMGISKIQEIEMSGKKFAIKTYKNDNYSNMWCQTYSNQSQKMCEYLNKEINQTDKYGEINQIVIAKNKNLHGIAAYDYSENALYISEELVDWESFWTVQDNDYFAARSLQDVITHELSGHKAHWNAAIKHYEKNKGRFAGVHDAKQELEYNLRKYIISRQQNEPLYLKNVISENAYRQFRTKKLLNEAIADARILIEHDTLNDETLSELVKEVLSYDG